MSKTTFPFAVRKGSVEVKIYTSVSNRGYRAYYLSYWQDGVRKMRSFADFKEAKEEAKFVAKRLGSAEAEVLTLTSADRAAYLRARELLAPTGVEIEVAAAQLAYAKAKLKAVPLSVAVDFFLHRHESEPEPRTVRKVVDELVDTKDSDGASEVYLKILRYALGKFCRRFKGNIGEVSGLEVDAWLRSSGLSAKSRNNLRGSIRTLFRFAKLRKYLPKDHDEMDTVLAVKEPAKRIEFFTPSELIEVLSVTSERLIPFFTLGAFAGVRHAELLRLVWKDVQLEQGFIEIGAEKAKTASRRLVPIAANLRQWLAGSRQEDEPVCPLANMANEIADIVEAINAKRLAAWEEGQTQGTTEEAFQPFEWKYNGMRHSFITYRVAETQNVDQVALEAGNSRQMIFKNYRELVTPPKAREWFSITPACVQAAKGAETGMPGGTERSDYAI